MSSVLISPCKTQLAVPNCFFSYWCPTKYPQTFLTSNISAVRFVIHLMTETTSSEEYNLRLFVIT